MALQMNTTLFNASNHGGLIDDAVMQCWRADSASGQIYPLDEIHAQFEYCSAMSLWLVSLVFKENPFIFI